MVAAPRQLTLEPDSRAQLPLDLRPLRAGCAVMDCEDEPTHLMVSKVRTVLCEAHSAAYRALKFTVVRLESGA